MAAPAAAAAVQCVSCEISLPAKPRYMRIDGKQHWAVCTAMQLKFATCPPTAKAVHVPPACLPFGLLDCVTVQRTDGAADASTCVSLAVHRLFGRRESEQRPFGLPISLCGHELNIDDESAHQHLRDVYALTGHDFRYRMVAAGSVMNVAVQFHDGPAPAAFEVTFYGVNVLPWTLTHAAAFALVDAKARVEFVFPPLTPKARQQGAAAAKSSVEASVPEEKTSKP